MTGTDFCAIGALAFFAFGLLAMWQQEKAMERREAGRREWMHRFFERLYGVDADDEYPK